MISFNTKIILGVIVIAVIVLTFIGASSTVKEGFESWMGAPSCKYCQRDIVKKNLGAQYAVDPMFATICPSRGNEKDCNAAGGQWGPPPLHAGVCAAEGGTGFIKDFFDNTYSRQLQVSTCEAKCKATSGCKFWSTRMNDMGGCMLFSSCDSPRTDGGYGAYNTYTTVPPPPPKPTKPPAASKWFGTDCACYDPDSSAAENAASKWCTCDAWYGHSAVNRCTKCCGKTKPSGYDGTISKTDAANICAIAKPPPPDSNSYTCDLGWAGGAPMKCMDDGKVACASQDGKGCLWGVCNADGSVNHASANASNPNWKTGGKKPLIMSCPGWKSPSGKTVCDLLKCPAPPVPPPPPPPTINGYTLLEDNKTFGPCTYPKSMPTWTDAFKQKNPQECATACSSDPTCKGFNMNNEKCQLCTEPASNKTNPSGTPIYAYQKIPPPPIDMPTKGAYLEPCQGEKQYWLLNSWVHTSTDSLGDQGNKTEAECEKLCDENSACGVWLLDHGGTCHLGKITGGNNYVSCGKPGSGSWHGKMKCSQAQYPITNDNNNTTYNKATCNATCRGFKCPAETKAKWKYSNSGPKSCANLGPGWKTAAYQASGGSTNTKANGGHAYGNNWVPGPGGYNCSTSGCYSSGGCEPGCPDGVSSSWTCQPKAPAPAQCAGPTCTKGECCSGQCSSFTCPGGTTAKDPNITCTGTGCDATQCCTPNPKCSSLSSCPAGRQFKAGKNSITCAAAKCVSTECCEAIPHEKCSGFTCAQNSSKKTGVESTTCKGIMCTEDECCSPDPKPNCGNQKVSCPSGYHTISNAGATQCNTYQCTSQECCAPNPTCSAMSCPAGTTKISSSILCKGATCLSSECCRPNPTCGTYKCPSGMDRVSSSALCSGGSCTTEDCCMPRATCASFGSCDKLHTDAPTTKQCAGTECTSEECCIPNPTCSAYPCGKGFTKKTDADNITCENEPCEKSECCYPNATCKGFICPAGEARKLLSDSHTCEGPECTDNECCGSNPTCETHSCSSSFYENSQLLSNAARITCGAPTCTDPECCTTTPSYNLPKVNVWPLFKNN